MEEFPDKLLKMCDAAKDICIVESRYFLKKKTFVHSTGDVYDKCLYMWTNFDPKKTYIETHNIALRFY